MQFGIAGKPKRALQHWRNRTIKDDVLTQHNTIGYVAFSNTGPDTRSTQIYINLGDNSARNDGEAGFAPFGKVVVGMEVVEKLYSGYGENSGGGMRAGHQDKMFEEGNASLDRDFQAGPSDSHNHPQMTTPRYIEDIAVGEKRTSEPYELSEADSVAFAQRYDPQPMHVDRGKRRRARPIPRPDCERWLADHRHRHEPDRRHAVPFGSTPLLGLGVPMSCAGSIPVRPGDRITGESEVISIPPSKSKPQFGIVRVHITGRNQKNEVVLSMFSSLWIAKRPIAETLQQ